MEGVGGHCHEQGAAFRGDALGMQGMAYWVDRKGCTVPTVLQGQHTES